MSRISDAKDGLIDRFIRLPLPYDEKIAILLSWIKHDDLDECLEHLKKMEPHRKAEPQ